MTHEEYSRGIGRSDENSVLEVDPKRYGRLLARKLPAVIRTEEENERLIAELERFDKRYDQLTPEERECSELLTVLIEAFEDASYALVCPICSRKREIALSPA